MGRVRQRHNDESAYRRLFTDHIDAVTGYAMRRAAPADAADVVAETMLVAWRRLAAVPAEPATRPWLLGWRAGCSRSTTGRAAQGQVV